MNEQENDLYSGKNTSENVTTKINGSLRRLLKTNEALLGCSQVRLSSVCDASCY
jgi:hypothetical protein